MLTRYAGYEHWKATRQSVGLGGNGPDYDKLREAVRLRRSITIETSVEFLQGYMYQSPPIYLPGLKERYRLTDQERKNVRAHSQKWPFQSYNIVVMQLWA